MDSFERPVLNLDLSSQYNSAMGVAEKMKLNRESIDAMARKQEEIEEEKRVNLRRIADNSEETVNSLKETNELLKKQIGLLEEKNEKLNVQLDEIIGAIKLLVEVTRDVGDTQEKNMTQANALALQLCVTAEENVKFDWKTFLANTSANGLMLGLQVFLHQHGLI